MESRETSKKLVLSEEVKTRIIQEGRKEAFRRKRSLKIRCGIVTLLLIAGIAVSQVMRYPEKGMLYPVKVYAQEDSGINEIDLVEQAVFPLEKKETPLGLGYELYTTAEKGYYCKTVVDDMGYGLDTVFLDEHHVYWIPDYWKNDNIKIYDEDGEILDNENASKDHKAKVTYCVYDEDEILRFQMTVQLREENGTGEGEIIELICYPVFID